MDKSVHGAVQDEKYQKMMDVLEGLHQTRGELILAEERLETFERNIRVSDPVYTELMGAKNDTQRKLILERSYAAAGQTQANPHGDWYPLKTEIAEIKRSVKNMEEFLEVVKLAYKYGE